MTAGALRVKRRPVPPLLWVLLGGLAACNLAFFWRPDWQPVSQADQLTHSVYAYRQWQSMGVKLEAGDRYSVRAQGNWLYSPIVGLHGPQGGRPAVPSYPMPNVPGGALIGRIGESALPFYVGARAGGVVTEGGYLFLRINDDLLGDNAGVMAVDIAVVRATATPGP
jgi:hypothetical protein